MTNTRSTGLVGEAPPFMQGGGACGELMRATDWSRTPVGPISGWPESLKTTIGTLLHSRHPMFLWWGPDLVQFYNDAYVPSFGQGKHPAAMGQRGADCWQEIWPIIWPQIDDVMSLGKASWNEDHLVPIYRNGRIEEVYWTYGYSPVFREDGRVGGTLVVCTETTTRVIAARRLHTLGQIAEQTNAAISSDTIVEAAQRVFRIASADIAFSLLYLGSDSRPSLACSTGVTAGQSEMLDATFRRGIAALQPSPLPTALAEPLEIEGASWPEPVTHVWGVDIPSGHSASPAGFVLFGLSPRLPFDAAYLGHLDQLGAQIGHAHSRMEALRLRSISEARDRFLVQLDDAVRTLSDADAITLTAAKALGQHLGVNRCAYATVETDEDTFTLTGNYNDGVESIVGRYTFRQFGEECLRLMRAGQPYTVYDSQTDPRITDTDRGSYAATAIGAVICVPILKAGRFVAAMAVHAIAPRAWTADEVDLVQHVASRCWESIERARVTDSLRESERQFRELANSIANLAWMARPDGSVYWFNDQWYAYTGMTADEMLGPDRRRMHDPAVLPEVLERWQQSLTAGIPFEMVFPLRGADGTFRRFLTRVNPVRDSYGNVVRWFGTSTDVESERRATEANMLLREREHTARQEAELQKRLLHSLFMQAPTLIAILQGPNHVIALANPPMCQAWARKEHELLNRPLVDALPELRDQIFISLLDQVFLSGQTHFGRETPAVIFRGGEPTMNYFDFAYSAFHNVQGEIEGVYVIASDVTAQVVARNEIDILRRAAEGANRAKDEFLAMLGHELRNPLSPILTAVQLMKLRSDVSSERERTVIERQVAHLTRLVDDLLDVSRIARGKVELKKAVIEIESVVAKGIEMCAPLFEQRMHTLKTAVPTTGLAIEGDVTRLSQVVANLLNNAAKYTPPGGTITIVAEPDETEVVLRIRDTGIGIDAEVLPHVFDLFVQERQAIDRAQGGLGLGLAIVRNLVEGHGGTVVAHSEGPGRGTEVVVRLPRAGTAVTTAQEQRPAGTLRPAGEPPPTPLRILVVDDNEDAAELLATALRTHGHEVRIAHDAPTAMNVATSFAPEVAFLDIGLPVMDGYELGARLRALRGLERLRLIALTGYGQTSDRDKTRAAGFEHHLVKPVDFHILAEVMAGAQSGRS